MIARRGQPGWLRGRAFKYSDNPGSCAFSSWALGAAPGDGWALGEA